MKKEEMKKEHNGGSRRCCKFPWSFRALPASDLDEKRKEPFDEEGEYYDELTVQPKNIHIIGCDGDDKTLLSRYASHFVGCTIKSCYFSCFEGVVDRVFWREQPEMSPDISYYSQDEYPQRDFALSCGIRASFCFPLFKSRNYTTLSKGVVEIVSTHNQDVNALWKFCESFQQLGCFFGFETSNIQMYAIPKIKQLLEVVCQKFQLPLAQYWIWHSDFHSRYSVVQQVSCREFENLEPWSQFKHACLQTPLESSEGLFYTGHCFCRDVTKLSITNHPFTHYARDCGSIACLTICLYNPFRKCILEFFLPSQDIDSYYPQTLLQSLFSKTQEHLPDYIIKGEELGQMVSFKVINSLSHEEPESFNIVLPKSNSYLPHHEGSGCNPALNLFQNEEEWDVPEETSPSQHMERQEILKYKGTTAEIGHSALKMTLEEALKPKQHTEIAERADEPLKKSIIEDTGYATCNVDTRNAMPSTSQPYTLCQQAEIVILEDEGDTSQQLPRISQMWFEDSTEQVERVFGMKKRTPDIDTYEEIPTGTPKKIPEEVEQIMHLDELKGKSPLKCVEPQSLPSQQRRSEEIFGDEGYIVATERVDNLVDLSSDENVGYAVTTPSKRLKKSKLPCTKENISKHFRRPLKDAAESFGVSVSTFKRRCRDVGILWWPSSKSKIIDGEPGENNFSSGNQTVSNRPVVIHSRQDSNTMTVKITYNTVTIRFELPSSSGIAELENSVIESLPLERKSFSLKYQDEEGDWISITRDKDVQECIKVSRSLNKPTIKMLVGPPINNHAP